MQALPWTEMENLHCWLVPGLLHGVHFPRLCQYQLATMASEEPQWRPQEHWQPQQEPQEPLSPETNPWPAAARLAVALMAEALLWGMT